MKKALLFGDYKAGTWHPLRDVDEAIIRVLDDFEVTVCEEYPALTLEALQAYDVVINYIDAWGKRGNTDFAGALIGYVAGGGALLSLHGGIIAHSLSEIEQMIGGSFTNHPPREVIEYVHSAPHPIMRGVDPFSLDEEPYMFTMDNVAKLTMLMEYVYKGEKYPAAWLRGYGRGKSCYLSMGHTAESFENEGCAKLLRRCALWCVDEL